MFRMFRCRASRRPAAILGAACTGAFLGVLFLNKLLTNRVTCVATCAGSKYLSYERLQKNEASRKVKHHPVVKSFDVNFLPSNTPIEDRFVAGISPSLGTAMFSVIDGHKGFRCSDYLQKHLLRHISSILHKETGLVGEDLQILLDMSTRYTQSEVENSENGEVPAKSLPSLSEFYLEQWLEEAFVSLDDNISNEALSNVKLVRQGHSFSPAVKATVMRAVEGACVIAALVLEKSISVANTGDCRVVLGHRLPNGAWKAVPLSVDQSAKNPLEVERLMKEHPGEEKTVIFADRVLGSLMPFRTFGDVDFKWEKHHLEGYFPTWPNYLTPPYITAKPVVTRHKLTTGDKFMIIASDGLWERMGSEKAVEIVAEAIEDIRSSSTSILGTVTGLFTSREETSDGECCRENLATRLLWYALGGTDENVTALLNLPATFSRMYRDDITIMVVVFRDDLEL